MKKNFYLLAIVLCTFVNAIAQNDDKVAHYKSYTAIVTSGFDSRVSSLMLKPEVNAKFLNGTIDFSAHVGMQLRKLESWDLESENRAQDALVGANTQRKYGMFEAQIGANYLKIYNDNATIISRRSSGNFDFYSFQPGSKAFLLGGHVGIGSSVSKVGIYDQPFNLQDENGYIYTKGEKFSKQNRTFDETYANVYTDYIFIGSHNTIHGKASANYNHGWGGTFTTYYIDAIIPTRVKIGDMSSFTNEVYKAVPKTGTSLKSNGFRIGMIKQSSGLVGINSKVEFGIMPNYGTYGLGPTSFYGLMAIGIQIAPKLHYINLRDINN
jgi:hypothetical protein